MRAFFAKLLGRLENAIFDKAGFNVGAHSGKMRMLV